MVCLKDFEVRVALNTTKGTLPGEALKEHPNPKLSAANDEWSIERYIEAKAGEESQVEVYVKPGFNLYKADGIMIGLRIDVDTVAYKQYIPKKKVCQRLLTGRAHHTPRRRTQRGRSLSDALLLLRIFNHQSVRC